MLWFGWCWSQSLDAASFLFPFFWPIISLKPLWSAVAAEVVKFWAKCPFHLESVMAGLLDHGKAGQGIEGSSSWQWWRVMARLGHRVSFLGAWFTARPPSETPLLTGFGEEDACPDMGIVFHYETAGIGGFGMATAPALVTCIGGPHELPSIPPLVIMRSHWWNKHFTIPFRIFVSPTGVDIHKVVVPNVNPGDTGSLIKTQVLVSWCWCGQCSNEMLRRCTVAFCEKLAYNQVDVTPTYQWESFRKLL